MFQLEVAPHRMALLNVDIQNVFVEMAANSLEVVDRINRLAAVCRSAGIPVIHVRHAHPAGADTGLLRARHGGALFAQVTTTDQMIDEITAATAEAV